MKGAVSAIILLLTAAVIAGLLVYNYSTPVENPTLQRTITGRAISDIPSTAPSVCISYHKDNGDTVCDDSEYECPKGTFVVSGPYPSVPECNECQTGGFDCSQAAITPTASSISKNCKNLKGSCAGKICGKYYNAVDKCGCDDLCETYNDCYPDYLSFCKSKVSQPSVSPTLTSKCADYGKPDDNICDAPEDHCNLGYFKGTSAPGCNECTTGKWIDCKVICNEDSCINLASLIDHAYIERPLETVPDSYLTGAAVAVPELKPEFFVQPILFVPKDVQDYPSSKYFLTPNDPLLKDPLIKSLNEQIEATRNFYKEQIGKTFAVQRFVIVRGDWTSEKYLCDNFNQVKNEFEWICKSSNLKINIMGELIFKKGLHYNPLRIDLIFVAEPAIAGGVAASIGIPFIFSKPKFVGNQILGTNWAIVHTAFTKASISGCDSLKDLTYYESGSDKANAKEFCNIIVEFFTKLSQINENFDGKLGLTAMNMNTIIHELGHQFGLPHPDEKQITLEYGYYFSEESKEYKTSPMGGGILGSIAGIIAGEFTGFQYGFLPEEREILLNSPFFKSSQPQ